MKVADLYRSPNALAPYYRRFRVEDRLLLTGHSHQAWPDVGFDAHQQAWHDAAEHVDDKWDLAFERADRVRAGFARLLDDSEGDIALGANTHELVVRLLSALPLGERPRIVTTDGEFHTLRRQLDRHAEEGLEIVRVTAEPLDTVAARLADAIDGRTALAAVSSVFFRSARIVPGLAEVAAVCRRRGAALLVDAYHSLDVVPFSIPAMDLRDAFVVGGGYKYCQLGEGNCFLRLPPACDLRPVVTGWFAEFDLLSQPHDPKRVVAYGAGSARFAGSTYDPTSHYRAAAVFDFFEQRGLAPELLRRVSQHQVGRLIAGFDGLDLDPAVIDRDRDIETEEIAGFLVLNAPRAEDICGALRDRGVLSDHRGETLRLGPAPYLSDDQLDAAVEALGEVISRLDGV